MHERRGDDVVVEELRCSFGRRIVLDGISLAVPAGSVFALLGQNGEGKTTLVRCLLGQLRPGAGRISVLGRDPWRRRAVLMEEVGVVPETPDLPPSRRVGEILRFWAGLYPRWQDEAAGERLERFGIGLKRRVAELSRGHKAQLILALVLAAAPRLLVLDDPTLGLDVLARRELHEELIGELAERGTTVFLTSHDLDGVERLADRVAILAGGRIVAGGTTEELKREWGDRLARPVSLEDIFIGLVRPGEAA
ncbi:MAG: ABC transporter ATP-binding protein [Acidobacteria bacterium]|nr:ABC transporter ATP-binding protein [Acidobacteriota bacterium]